MHLSFFHVVNAREDCSNGRCWSPLLISLTGNSSTTCPDPDPRGIHSGWALGPSRAKASTGAGNVTTLMTRQTTFICWVCELIPIRRQFCLTLLNICEGFLVAHNLGLQTKEEICTVGAFYGRMVSGLASGNSCSCILPAPRMLERAIPTYWS